MSGRVGANVRHVSLALIALAAALMILLYRVMQCGLKITEQ